MAQADTTVPEANQDDLILAQQKSIETEISATIPLIGPMEDVSCLLNEYNADAIYREKVMELSKKFSKMRRTRPDGNCFYRAFAFRYFETLATDKAEYDKFHQLALKSKDELLQLGFVRFTLEDFHETFMEVLNRIGACRGDIGEVEAVFGDQPLSDYVVVYMRLLTSGHMQRNADFYINFVDGFTSVKEFCKLEVEPMYKECDHVQVSCLSSALSVPLHVQYVDRDAGSRPVGHDFRPDSDSDSTSPARVTLLYRPGHYDVLYAREQI